jgi:hypothetical protein
MATQAAPRENIWLNLGVNVLIPTVILSKFSGENALGPTGGLVVALAFPILYGLVDFIRAKRVNVFSLLGVISVLLTGGMALLKLPPDYIAIKEAAIPGLLGLGVLISLATPYPLVKTLIQKTGLIQEARIEAALVTPESQSAYEKALGHCSWMVAGSFFVSSALNYGLAKWLLVSEPGTEAFNAELGKMTALSFPVIAIPSTLVMMAAILFLFYRIGKLTGLPLESIMAEPK